jgi:hypothetical protein
MMPSLVSPRLLSMYGRSIALPSRSRTDTGPVERLNSPQARLRPGVRASTGIDGVRVAASTPIDDRSRACC